MANFANIFDGWSLPIVVFDQQLNLTYCNHAYELAVGKSLADMVNHNVFDLFPESKERVAYVERQFRTALAGTRTSLNKARFNLTDETGVTTERVWQATQEPYRDSDGNVTHIIQRADDVTNMVKAEEERVLVQEELDHRMKNIHTVIQAMARLSSKSASSVEEYRDSFIGRLQSMSRAHERLLSSDNHRAMLFHVIRDEIKGVAADFDDAVTLNGPDLLLPAAVSRSVSMLVHELSTNAVKYGCFNYPNGTLDIDWHVHEGILHMSWKESGLTNLTAPEETGFGSKMIRMISNIEFEADYQPTGLHAIIKLPLEP